MKIKNCLKYFTLLLTLLMSCSPKSESGYAPDNQAINPIVTPTPTSPASPNQPTKSIVSYKQVYRTNLGWVVESDSVAPVNNFVTTSGWKIEVFND